jgi:hypothetical protein
LLCWVVANREVVTDREPVLAAFKCRDVAFATSAALPWSWVHAELDQRWRRRPRTVAALVAQNFTSSVAQA